MDIKSLLGRKIKQYRILRGYSQERLAELLNISQRTLSGIECGANFLTSQTLDKILEVLKISPDELFYVEYLKDDEDLVLELISDIKNLKNSPEKLKIAYKIIKSIIKD